MDKPQLESTSLRPRPSIAPALRPGCDETLAPVLDALRSDQPRVQAQAARLTLDLPGPEVTKALLEALPNLPRVSQARLLEALAERKKK